MLLILVFVLPTMLLLDKNIVDPYQKLLDRIPYPAWIINSLGQIYLANTAWSEYRGRSLSKEKSILFWDFLPAAERDEAKTRWQKNLAQSTQSWQSRNSLQNILEDYSLYDLEVEVLSDDAYCLWLLTAIPVESISLPSELEPADYKQKELQLERNVEFVRRIIESSQDCIKVLDLEGRLLYMNDGGQDIMEVEDFTAIQNAPWLSFWSGCDRQNAEQAFARALEGENGRFDGYCATAKGTPRWWEVVVTPMFDRDGRVQEILSVSRDITARKKAQATLQKRNQELDRYTYIVTHDLKAPLRGISYLSSWIVEDLGDRLPSKNQEQLNLLKQRVQRMSAFVDGLLEFSKIGRENLSSESIPITQLLDEITDSLCVSASFKIVYAKSLPIVTTKRILLTQVLSNLISNAIEHHDCDEGYIEITVREYDTYYQFAIADDGPGIADCDKERVFKIFQTLNKNTSNLNTGIGLALVKKIIEEEKGELWLEKNNPRGCKFNFIWRKTD